MTLTRRGRLVLVLTAMSLLLAAGLTLGHGSSQASSGARVAPRTMTVQPGDTLWSVAQRIAPQQDPRLVVADLEALNQLPGDQLIAGQRLLLPTFR